VTGAFTGFASAALLIMLIAALKVGLGPRGARSSLKEVYGYALQVMAYTLVFNLIFKLDLLMMKPAALATLGAAESDRLMGIYNLALQVSRLPWQVTIAVTFVIFPLLSEATFAQDEERSKTYIQQTLRYLLILVGAACAGLFALPQTVTSLFPESYSEMTTALVWTAPAYLCFTLFNLCNTLLMSAGRATSAFIIGIATVSIAAGLYWLTLYSEIITLPQSLSQYITVAGQVALFTFMSGLLMGLGRLWVLFGAPIPLGTALRTLVASLCLWLVGQQIESSSRIILLSSLAGLGALFFLVLILLGEWSREERAALKSRFLRRRDHA
jgi:O-antigen/teichoic acid export membrane protein